MWVPLEDSNACQNDMGILGVTDRTGVVEIKEMHLAKGGREGNKSPAAC
jgi:hypothetical protein